MGGVDAEIGTTESVDGLAGILQTAGPAQNGQFFNYTGEVIPW